MYIRYLNSVNMCTFINTNMYISGRPNQYIDLNKIVGAEQALCRATLVQLSAPVCVMRMRLPGTSVRKEFVLFPIE